MAVIYVTSRSSGLDAISFPFRLENASELSATMCIKVHTENFPSACLWLVPGTYEQED